MKKKLLIIGVVFVVAGLVYYKTSYKEKVLQAPILGVPLAESRAYCFSRLQEATIEAPYKVEEFISLTRVRGTVSGTKQGTQSGPDMTNGYDGTLEGTTDGAGLELVYSYTIEGSQNKELELYSFSGEDLVKQRYPLKEEKRNGVGMLVPDQSATPTSILYTQAECK